MSGINIDAVIKKYGKPPTKSRGLPVQVVANPGHQTEVVGEYYRHKAVEAAADKTGGYGWAVLRPEPDNKHDPNAIGVWVGSRKIGFIESGLAQLMQPKILELQDRCGQALACPVEIDDSGWPNETTQAYLILDSDGVIAADSSSGYTAGMGSFIESFLVPLWKILTRCAHEILEHRKLIFRLLLAFIIIMVVMMVLRVLATEVGDFINIMF